MDKRVLEEMKCFLMLLLRAPVPEEERQFGDPLRYLADQFVHNNWTFSEFIEHIDGGEFPLNGAGLKMYVDSKGLEGTPFITIAGDQARYFPIFLDTIQKRCANFKHIKIIVPKILKK